MQCSITKLPKYFIENPILPFDKSKDNTSLELTSCQIPLISLLCYRTSLFVLLQVKVSHAFVICRRFEKNILKDSKFN